MQQSVSKPQQYPAATGPYKVFIKGKSTWRGHKTARLHISMGNPKQDGPKLAAMTEWAAARFDKVIVIVSDSLQRHNIAVHHSVGLASAYALALTGGREWLARNKAALDIIPRANVMMWDDCLSHPDYAAARAELDSLYAKNEALQSAVKAKAMQFCKKRDSLAIETSVEFLLEEVAALGILFRQEPAADFYAGTWLTDVYGAIAALPTSGLLSGFQKIDFTEVDFVRNRAV